MAQLPVDQQVELLTSGVVDLVSKEDLTKRLTLAQKENRPLKVKTGFDPTRPDLHLGHTVVMNKMRQFQELGHEVIFVVGDFTAAIGDPSGRNKTRPPLSREEILKGAESYAEQAFRILDRNKTRLVYNSSWLSPMTFDDVIRLAGKYTLARMMERDDFKTRWKESVSISLHELLYPLAQGQDSVHLASDVELGGTDQLFNLLVGRELMRESGQLPQIVMTLPILEGLNARVEDGKLVGDKMSKSLDNYVGIAEPPSEQYGKMMSISDDLMWRYYQLLSSLSPAQIADKKAAVQNGALHPKIAKSDLAKEIVTRFHGLEAAEAAFSSWEKQFSQREVPTEMDELTWSGAPMPLLIKVLADLKVLPSTNEAKRRVEGGAIELDGNKVTDIQHKLAVGTYTVKAGKRVWVKLLIQTG